ncbi:MAG: hypothetical protein AAF492_02585 [Verrucomicrobiota bacterium]
MKKTTRCSICVLSISFCLNLLSGRSPAATTTITNLPPLEDGNDIAMLNQTDATGGDLAWSDRPAVGQTFTIGSQDVLLNAVTFQFNNTFPGIKTYGIRIAEVTGNAITNIASDTFTQNIGISNGLYLTVTFETPVPLSANRQYGWDIKQRATTTGWPQGIPILRRNNQTNYPGGSAYTRPPPNGEPGATINSRAYDYVFHLDLTPVGLEKSVSETEVNLNQGLTNLTYTINVMNSYTGIAGGVVVTDALPDGVSFIASTPPPSQTNLNQYLFDLGSLGPGSNATVTINVAITSTVPQIITNYAIATSTNTNVLVIGSDTAQTRLFLPTDLAVTKNVSRFQTNYTYTMTVSNQSLVTADQVTLVDTLPPGSLFNTSTPSPDAINGDDITFNLGSLPPGGSIPITLSMIYTSTTPALITNSASVTSVTVEDNLTNNTAFAVAPTVNTNVELVLTKTVSPTNLTLGQSNLTYAITILNLSTVFAGTVTITDALPISVSFVNSSLPPSSTNGNQYAFMINFFGANASTTIVINAAYTSSAPGTITNWANVISTNTELSLANNADFAITTISGSPCIPGMDTDGDGMTDCDEICAGTDPMDPSDFLWLRIQTTGTASVHRLTFPSVIGRTYHLESRMTLLSNAWNSVMTNVPGLGIPIHLMRTGFSGRIYYRIGVE